MNELQRTMDYVKGRIKSLEKARKPLPYQKFDQNNMNKCTRKLHHYRFILEVLKEKQEAEKGEKNESKETS